MDARARMLHEIECTPNTKQVLDPQRSKFNGYRVGLQRAVTSWDEARQVVTALTLAGNVSVALPGVVAGLLESAARGTPEGANDNNKAYWQGYREGLAFAVKALKGEL